MGRSRRQKEARMAEMIDRALRLEGLLPPDRTPYIPEQSFPREKRAAVVPSNPGAMSAQMANVEHPPAFESAVDWCKRHLAGLDQAKVEAKPTFDKKRDLPNVHAWERDVVAPGNAAAVKPAAVVKIVKVTQLETGSSRCSVGNPDKTGNKVRCLRCSEWGHAVSKCPLSLAPMQSYLAKQRSAKPMLCAKREADQKPRRRVVAHSNTEEASRAVCGPWGVLACKGRDKWLPKEPIQHVGENQQSSAGRVRSPMTTRVEVVPGDKSCRRDLPQCPHKEPCAFLPAGNHQERNALEKSHPVPCLECGQLGHEMLSCPRFWGAPGGNDAEPVSCQNIFAVTPGNKEEVSVVSAGGAISSRGHQGELASKCAAEDCLRQRTEMKMVTPTTAVGKTVFNEMMSGTADCRYKRTGYETVHDDVRVTPVSGATKCVLEDYFSLQSGNAGVKVQTEPVLMTKSVVSNVCQSQVSSGLGQPAKTKNAISVMVNEKFAAVGKTPGSFRAKAVVTNGPLLVATEGKTAQLSPEISRELHVLKSEVAMDNWYVTLVGQSGTVQCNGNVLVQAASTKNVQVNGGLKQHVKNAKVCEAYEAPPEQGGGGCGVLQPVVLEHVLPKSAMICNLGNESATKPICSNVCPWADGSGLRSADEWSTATTDWDSWGKNLMSLIDEAFMHKSKVDKVSAVPAGGMAEQLIPEGAVAAAGVNPREKYGPHKGEHTADTLSATYKNDADVACQSDVVNGNVKQFIGAEPEKLSVSQAPGSALVEHQAVVVSSWEKVSLNLATSRVSAIESVCIPSVRKVPRKDFNPKPRVWFLTKVLKEMLTLWDVQPVYTGVSPPQSDSLVLRSTIRWTPEWQVVQHKGRQDKNGLFMTVLLVLKVASRYADGLLPVQEVYGRGFGEKKVSEVSPPNSQVEGISAAMVQDSTGQLSVKGVYTVPVVPSHEMEGPSVDQKAAEILTGAQPKVVKETGVPSPMFGLGDKQISAVKIVCGSEENLSLQVDKNTNGIRTGQVVGQLPAERVNPGEVTSSEVPVGDGNPLVCVPSADPALANTEKKGIGDFCNIERCKVGLNMYINDEPNNLLKVHDSVVSKGIGKPGNLKRGGRRVGRKTRGALFKFQKRKCLWNPKRRGRRLSVGKYSWLRSRVGRTWKRTRKKVWAYVADSQHRGVPTMMMGAGVPPSGSKQRGRVCDSPVPFPGNGRPGLSNRQESPILGPGFGNSQESGWLIEQVGPGLIVESRPVFWTPPSQGVQASKGEACMSAWYRQRTQSCGLCSTEAERKVEYKKSANIYENCLENQKTLGLSNQDGEVSAGREELFDDPSYINTVPKTQSPDKTPLSRNANINSDLGSPCESGNPPVSSSIQREEWFHGRMNRKVAENLLLHDGDFLVRESTTSIGQYVLSGLHDGHPKHLLLVDPEGKVRTKDHVFENVSHLIKHHVENELPIISSGSELCLRKPVKRQEKLKSQLE